MSSALSLIPTSNKSSKKRRPTFRPGAKRKKPKTSSGILSDKSKKITEKLKESALKITEKPKNDASNSINHSLITLKATTEKTNESASKATEKPKKDVPTSLNHSVTTLKAAVASESQCKPKISLKSKKKSKPIANSLRDDVRAKIGVAKEPKNISKKIIVSVASQSIGEKKPKEKVIKRVTSKQKSLKKKPGNLLTATRKKKTKKKGIEKNDDTSNSKVSVTAKLIPGSLAAFCTSYRAEKRPTDKTSKPSNPPPPPPPPPAEPLPDEKEKDTGPQVQIIDGEIVLQESSMKDPTSRKTIEEVEEEFGEVVEEEGRTGIVQASYRSYSNVPNVKQWTVKETEKFYLCLRQVGTDFITMEAFFKDRSRKQLKKKFRKELTQNPKLINLALDPRNKIPVDLSIFDVDKDSIVVVPYNKDDIAHIPTTDNAESRSKKMGEETENGKDDTSTGENIEEEAETVEEDPYAKFFEAAPEEQQQNVDDFFGVFAPISVAEQTDEFALEQEMGDDKPDDSLTLAPMISKKKSKRAKFRAGKRKVK